MGERVEVGGGSAGEQGVAGLSQGGVDQKALVVVEQAGQAVATVVARAE